MGNTSSALAEAVLKLMANIFVGRISAASSDTTGVNGGWRFAYPPYKICLVPFVSNVKHRRSGVLIGKGLAQQGHHHTGHAVSLFQHGHTGLRQHLVAGHIGGFGCEVCIADIAQR